MTSMDYRGEENLYNYMSDCKISEKTEVVRNFSKEKNPKKSCLFKDFLSFILYLPRKCSNSISFFLNCCALFDMKCCE